MRAVFSRHVSIPARFHPPARHPVFPVWTLPFHLREAIAFSKRHRCVIERATGGVPGEEQQSPLHNPGRFDRWGYWDAAASRASMSTSFCTRSTPGVA